MTKILLIEDNTADARLIREMLKEAKSAQDIELEWVQELSPALERLTRGDIDLVLSDLNLPDSQGLNTFLKLEEKAPQIPIVILTGLDDESAGIEAVKHGAEDYLVKGQVDAKLLLRVISYALERKHLQQFRDDFLHTATHELRAPLTTMKQFTSIILDEIPGTLNKEQREYLDIIQGSIGRLSRLINNLLDIFKIEAGKVELKRDLVDIVGLARQVALSFKPIAQSKTLEMKMDFSKEKIEAYVDKDKIIQVFTNLVDNALKFTQNGFIEISVAQKDDWVECAVSDTGSGIREEDLPKVFGKFQQFGQRQEDAPKGTGLGLSIVKGIVELHKGKIWVESKLGEGSSFKFRLPLET